MYKGGERPSGFRGALACAKKEALAGKRSGWRSVDLWRVVVCSWAKEPGAKEGPRTWLPREMEIILNWVEFRIPSFPWKLVIMPS